MTEAVKVATQLLKQYGSPEKALKAFMIQLRRRDALLQEVAFAFLNAIDQPSEPASKPASKPSAKQTEPKPTQADGSVKIKTFNVPGYRRRTHEEKQLALMARAQMADAVYEARMINGKALGDLAWGELRTLVAEQAVIAGSGLYAGTEAAVTTILLNKIMNYASVDDMTKKIRAVVPPDKIKQMIEEAQVEAPVFIQTFIQRYADWLKNGGREQRKIEG